jgi:hypothetical protein
MRNTFDMREIRKTLAKCGLLKVAYLGVRSRAMTTVCHISPGLLTRLRYWAAWGRWPDLDNPRTFDEKLQWLNLFWQHPLKARCGDKFTLRSYVEECGLGHLLPELLGVYSSSKEIRLESLPHRFVLKCSHGCKCNVFCPDKERLDWKMAKANLDFWMRKNFSTDLGEIHYGNMVPRIICEEFLQDGTDQVFPTDYKLFCFGGKPFCTMVATAREPNGSAKLAFYDLSWKTKLPYCLPEMATDQDFQKPAGYDEMLECAQELSRPFPFVRVDFYSINGRVRLGEMTSTPGACVSADYMTEVAQQELGRLIDLPDRIC